MINEFENDWKQTDSYYQIAGHNPLVNAYAYGICGDRMAIIFDIYIRKKNEI